MITVHQQPGCCTQQLCTCFWDTWYCNTWGKTCQIMRWHFHGITHFTNRRRCSVSGYRTMCFVRTLCLIRTSWLFGGKNTEAVCEYACKALQQSGNLATPTTQPWKDFYLMFCSYSEQDTGGKRVPGVSKVCKLASIISYSLSPWSRSTTAHKAGQRYYHHAAPPLA